LLRALQVCEGKGILFWELVSRLRQMREEYGEGAAWLELVLQSAIADEHGEWQREQEEKVTKPHWTDQTQDRSHSISMLRISATSASRATVVREWVEAGFSDGSLHDALGLPLARVHLAAGG
jgi:hypothetical protein